MIRHDINRVFFIYIIRANYCPDLLLEIDSKINHLENIDIHEKYDIIIQNSGF